MVTLTYANTHPEEFLGRDITMTPDGNIKISSRNDMQLIKFYDNLAQAIKLRLATAKGSNALNPDYGSTVYEALGTIGTIDTLQLVKMNVREALLQEPRIDSITSINPQFRDGTKNQIDVYIEVVPIQGLDTLNIVYSTFV